MEKTVSLVLVEQCNLNCSYCYEHHKKNTRMPIPLAKRILYDELCADDGSDEVYIDFFGGEPFLAFDIIKELFDYIRSIPTKKKYIVYSTTNGTLIHGDVQAWLEKNKDYFVCGLSIDGTREMHNCNRSNSFDRIDLPFFHHLWPDQPIKMTITPTTLNTLSDGIIFLHERGFKVSCNLAYGCDWSKQGLAEILERELDKLVSFYILHSDIEVCTMLSHGIEYLSEEPNEEYQKWCGTGTGMRVYSTEGILYPCQFFTPLSIGDTLSQKAKNLVFSEKISLAEVDQQCQNCPFLRICPTCLGYNFLSSGNIYHRDLDMCRFTKLEIFATSYLKAKLLAMGKLILDNDQLYRLISGIKIVQKELCMFT